GLRAGNELAVDASLVLRREASGEEFQELLGLGLASDAVFSLSGQGRDEGLGLALGRGAGPGGFTPPGPPGGSPPASPAASCVRGRGGPSPSRSKSSSPSRSLRS